MAKATFWSVTDTEARKRGEQTGLDTLVVHAVTRVLSVRGFPPFSAEVNALSTPPGEYGRKAETQKELTGAHKRWSMWFNSKQREEHQVLTS